MAISLKRSVRSRLLKTKFSQSIFVIAALLVVATALLPITAFNGKNAAAAEPWETDGWQQISVGSGHTCALDSQNKVYCWGDNYYGQLGDGTTDSKKGPVAVNTTGALNGKTINSIVAGSYFSCAIASDDLAYCWGNNDNGQLGDGTYDHSAVPVAVDMTGVLAGKTITALSASDNNTCVVASDNKAYCWGYNGYGSLGNNSQEPSTVPVPVDTTGVLDGKSVTAISVGALSTCAIADAQAYCWGTNSYAELGNGSTDSSLVPVAVDANGVLAGKTVLTLNSGANNSCVIASDNQAYCWGNNGNGQLGNDSTTLGLVPVAVDTTGVLAGKTVTSIDVGANYTCAVASDDAGYCWGAGGVRGDNSELYGEGATVPVPIETTGVLAGKTVSSLSAGQNHACALASDNQAYCWGFNGYGQLGDGTEEYRQVPVQVVAMDMTPEITSISRDSVLANGQTYKLDISGSNLFSTTVVKFGDTVMQSEVLFPGVLSVTIPTTGITSETTFDVTVTNTDGSSDTIENGFTYWIMSPQAIAGANFSTIDERSEMHVYGSGFFDDSDSPIDMSRSRSLVTLNGVALPLCLDFLGPDMTPEVAFENGFITSPDIASNVPTCYMVADTNYQSTLTETSARIWLANDFDTTATGTVSINGSAPFTYNVPREPLSPIVTSVTPSEAAGRKMLAINGSDFMYSDASVMDLASSRSLVTLNGVALPFCAEIFGGLTPQQAVDFQIVDSIELVSATPACYMLVDFSAAEPAISYTTTKALIWMTNDADLNAPGTVSVNGSPAFAFNQAVGGGDNGSGDGTGTGTDEPQAGESSTVVPGVPNTGARLLDLSQPSNQITLALMMATGVAAAIGTAVVVRRVRHSGHASRRSSK